MLMKLIRNISLLFILLLGYVSNIYCAAPQEESHLSAAVLIKPILPQELSHWLHNAAQTWFEYHKLMWSNFFEYGTARAGKNPPHNSILVDEDRYHTSLIIFDFATDDEKYIPELQQIMQTILDKIIREDLRKKISIPFVGFKTWLGAQRLSRKPPLRYLVAEFYSEHFAQLRNKIKKAFAQAIAGTHLPQAVIHKDFVPHVSLVTMKSKIIRDEHLLLPDDLSDALQSGKVSADETDPRNAAFKRAMKATTINQRSSAADKLDTKYGLPFELIVSPNNIEIEVSVRKGKALEPQSKDVEIIVPIAKTSARSAWASTAVSKEEYEMPKSIASMPALPTMVAAKTPQEVTAFTLACNNILDENLYMKMAKNNAMPLAQRQKLFDAAFNDTNQFKGKDIIALQEYNERGSLQLPVAYKQHTSYAQAGDLYTWINTAKFNLAKHEYVPFKTPGAEGKGFLIVYVQTNDAYAHWIAIVNTHLQGGAGAAKKGRSYFEFNDFRNQQLTELFNFIQQRAFGSKIKNWIVCGDFNTDAKDAQTYKNFMHAMTSAKSRAEKKAAMNPALDKPYVLNFHDVDQGGASRQLTSISFSDGPHAIDDIFYSDSLRYGTSLSLYPPTMGISTNPTLITHGPGDASRPFYSDHRILITGFTLPGKIQARPALQPAATLTTTRSAWVSTAASKEECEMPKGSAAMPALPTAASKAEEREWVQFVWGNKQFPHYSSLHDKYDGAPNIDPLFKYGIPNYDPKKGLNLKYKNKFFKTAYELYKSLEKELGKYPAMETAMRIKFEQHKGLQDLLLSTGNKLPVNASTDEFWGMGEEDKGANSLGNILKDVRNAIRAEQVQKRAPMAKKIPIPTARPVSIPTAAAPSISSARVVPARHTIGKPPAPKPPAQVKAVQPTQTSSAQPKGQPKIIKPSGAQVVKQKNSKELLSDALRLLQQFVQQEKLVKSLSVDRAKEIFIMVKNEYYAAIGKKAPKTKDEETITTKMWLEKAMHYLSKIVQEHSQKISGDVALHIHTLIKNLMI